MNSYIKTLTFGVLCLFFTGCASIGYRSNQKSPDISKSEIKAKFQIKELTVSSPAQTSWYNGEINQVCQFLGKNDALQDLAEKSYPNLFLRHRESIPLNVKIDIDYDYNWSRFLQAIPSGLSWGIIPSTMESDHDIEVNLSIEDKLAAISKRSKGNMLVERNGWMSLPLFTALIDSPYSSDIPEETLVMSPAAEVLVTERGQKFFREKLVEQLVSQLANMDSRQLNKAYILRRNKLLLVAE